jgi:hypothetical protein
MLRCHLGSYVLCVPDVPYGGLSQQLVSTFPAVPSPACISARVLGFPVKLRLRRGAVACA